MRHLIVAMLSLLWISMAWADAAPAPDDDDTSDECSAAADGCEACESHDDTPTLCEESYSGTEFELDCVNSAEDGSRVEVWCDESGSGGGGCVHTGNSSSPWTSLVLTVSGIAVGIFFLRRR